MSFLTSKHTIVAMLVAPVLAVLAYYSIDYFVAEKPHAAREGESYELAEKPNCRYASGVCGLKNGDFELTLTFERLGEQRLMLLLHSAFPLDGVRIARHEGDEGSRPPEAMMALGEDRRNWAAEISGRNPDTARLRLVAATQGTLYYGDAAMKFTVVPDSDG